jgi:hypothetical protein
VSGSSRTARCDRATFGQKRHRGNTIGGCYRQWCCVCSPISLRFTFLVVADPQRGKTARAVHPCLPIYLVFGVRPPHWLNLPRATRLLGSASQLRKASRQRLVRGLPGCGICDDPEFCPLRPPDSILVTHRFYRDSDPRIPDWPFSGDKADGRDRPLRVYDGSTVDFSADGQQAAKAVCRAARLLPVLQTFA